jgi:hypothetical protein
MNVFLRSNHMNLERVTVIGDYTTFSSIDSDKIVSRSPIVSEVNL